MRRVVAVTLFILAGPPSAHAADIDAAGRVEAVTVFPDRAQVTRVARVDVPAGAHTVVFEGLPGQLLGDSLRVEGTGSAAIAIGSVDSRPAVGEQPAGDKERDLLRRLIELRDKRALVDADIKALEIRQTFIEAIGRMAPDGAGKDLKKSEMQPERWQQAWATLETGAAETFRAIVQKQIERRGLDDAVRKAEDDLKRLQTGRRDSLTVRVNVEAAAAAKLTLALRYQVPDAGWRPQYEARLDTASGRIALAQQGVVRQRTGEDWPEVELTLSTARPGLGTRPPELGTWWLDYFEPRPMAAAPEARVLMKQEPQRDAATPQDVRAGLVEAETVAGEFAAEYRIPGRATVPADSSERKVAIATHEMAAQLAVRAVPKIDPAAYLTAEAKYTGAAPLLPGSLLLFRDGAFVGNGRLDLMRPDETARLSFGIDDKVRIKHSLLAGQISQQGLLNRDRRIERKYRTVVENLHRQPLRVAILDNLPVSRQEAIRIELLTDATTPGFARDVDDKTGVLAWESAYQPGEKRTIDFGYAVSFPRDRQVPGF